MGLEEVTDSAAFIVTPKRGMSTSVRNILILKITPDPSSRSPIVNRRPSRARGSAANQATVASQEDLAAKACRGQPMFLPRPPPEWEAAGEAVDMAAAAKVRMST